MINRRHRRLVLAVAATLVAASPAHAQNVRAVVDDVARSWGRADAASIASAASRSGVSVEIDGDRHGPLNGRQASAALRRIFDERETVQVRAGMAKVVEGSPGRAFGEIVWTARMRGTTQPQRSTIFLALVLEDERWRITEIRVLR
jgi:hypothetical protein